MPFYNALAPTVRDSLQVQDQCDSTGSPYANNEGRKATYHVVSSGIVVTANGVFFSLQGSATKTVRVTRAYCSGLLTVGANVLIQVYRTTAAVSSASGTTAITPRLLDTQNSAATAVATSYTTSTLGTGNTLVSATRAFYPNGSATSNPAEFLFGGRNSQTLVLRGTSEFMQISTTASSYTGALFDLDIEFTEE